MLNRFFDIFSIFSAIISHYFSSIQSVSSFILLYVAGRTGGNLWQFQGCARLRYCPKPLRQPGALSTQGNRLFVIGYRRLIITQIVVGNSAVVICAALACVKRKHGIKIFNGALVAAQRRINQATIIVGVLMLRIVFDCPRIIGYRPAVIAQFIPANPRL